MSDSNLFVSLNCDSRLRKRGFAVRRCHFDTLRQLPPALVAELRTAVDKVAPTTDSGLSPHPALADLERLLHPTTNSDGGALVEELLMIQDLQSLLYAATVERLALLTEPGMAGDPTALVERRLAENSLLASLTADQVEIIRAGETVLAAEQLAVAQVGAALKIAPGTASRRVREAVDLVEQLPGTVASLTVGEIDQQRARTLADRSLVLNPELRAILEQRLLPDAMTYTPRQWRSRVEAEVLALDPAAAEQRHRDAVERRRLRLDQLDDGIGRFLADLPAHQAQLAWDLFDAVAQALRGADERTVDQRRADAFVTIVEMLAAGQCVTVADILGHPELTVHDGCHAPHLDPQSCCGTENTNCDAPPEDQDAARAESSDDHSESIAVASEEKSTEPAAAQPAATQPTATQSAATESAATESAATSNGSTESWCAKAGCGCGQWQLPTRQGRRTHTTVVITVEALAGLCQDAAQLAGHGVITADYARLLAAATDSVSFLVQDNDGRPLAIGDRVYRPPQRLKDKVVTAYPTCVFTGCHRPSDQDDLDHRDEFDQGEPLAGGATEFKNLHPLCRHHHRLKTFGGWSYRPAAASEHGISAAFVFRSPLGFETVSRVDHPVRPRSDVPAPF